MDLLLSEIDDLIYSYLRSCGVEPSDWLSLPANDRIAFIIPIAISLALRAESPLGTRSTFRDNQGSTLNTLPRRCHNGQCNF